MSNEIILIDSPNAVADYPRLALPLLTAIVNEKGGKASYIDLNIRFRDKIVSRECLNYLESSYLPEILSKIIFDKKLYKKIKMLYNFLSLIKIKDSFMVLEEVKQMMQARKYHKIFKSEQYSSAVENLFKLQGLISGFFDVIACISIIEDINPEFFIYKEIDKLIDSIINKQPEYIGFSVSTMNRPFVKFLSQRLAYKNDFTKSKIIIGGSDVSYYKEKFLEDWSWIDAAVVHEGDDALPLLLNSNNNQLNEIPNLIWRKDNKIIINEIKTPKISKVTPKFINTDLYLSDMLPIQASRGCPWGKCVFCIHWRTYSKQYSQLLPNIVVKQLEELSNKYKTKRFHFADDEMPAKLKDKVAEEIIRRKLDLSIIAYSRFDENVTKKRLFNWHQAGFKVLEFGMESASQRILNVLNKGIKVSEAQRILNDAAEIGILCKLFMFNNAPEENIEDFRKSIEFLGSNIKAGIIRPFFEITTKFELLRGSPLFDQIFKKNKNLYFKKTRLPSGKFIAQAGYITKNDSLYDSLLSGLTNLAQIAKRFGVFLMNDEAISIDLILEDIENKISSNLVRHTRLIPKSITIE